MKRPIRCSACGAPSEPGAIRCSYCGNRFVVSPGQEDGLTKVRRPRIVPAPDFGFSGRVPLLGGLLLAGALYALGWHFEDTEYWLADKAIAVWAVALPLWLCFFAFWWKAGRAGVLTGFFFSLLLFLIHMGVIWFVDRRIHDDGAGISAMFAGAALGGWLLGRGVHRLVRIRKNRSANQAIDS